MPLILHVLFENLLPHARVFLQVFQEIHELSKDLNLFHSSPERIPGLNHHIFV
jgi:hypothetical protein